MKRDKVCTVIPVSAGMTVHTLFKCVTIITLIFLLYARNDTEWPADQKKALVQSVRPLYPNAIMQKMNRYRRWQDQQAAILGKWLLIQGLNRVGGRCDLLKTLFLTAYGRPCFDASSIDFNISHSGNSVVCAIGKSVRVGVDVEVERHCMLNNFQSMLPDWMWLDVQNAQDKHSAFFSLWTQVEAVLKAEGIGLRADIKAVKRVSECRIALDQTWKMHTTKLDEDTHCAVAQPVDGDQMIERQDIDPFS
ncbi:MAG: 4'-phosphopantetheinyl transferase superfamily protein [Magnetococcales bacterium]|nr:4'-phosphopantetheinyl transferase superfamily protein [Magnetococcales bacterium]